MDSAVMSGARPIDRQCQMSFLTTSVVGIELPIVSVGSGEHLNHFTTGASPFMSASITMIFELISCSSKSNTTDIFMKALPEQCFKQCIGEMGVENVRCDVESEE